MNPLELSEIVRHSHALQTSPRANCTVEIVGVISNVCQDLRHTNT